MPGDARSALLSSLITPVLLLLLQGVWFTAIMFITNVFFIPFMALRAMPEPPEPAAAVASGSSSSSSAVAQRPRKVAVPGSQQLPSWSPASGAFGAFIGVFAIYWALAGGFAALLAFTAVDWLHAPCACAASLALCLPSTVHLQVHVSCYFCEGLGDV
jgi:hypothetical protein